MTSFLLLQLADSAFPTGGFAHSNGLEALVQNGEVARASDVETFACELLLQTTHGALPFVAEAHESPARLVEIDTLCRATLWSRVAAHASRAQGRALLQTATRAFDRKALSDAKSALARGELDGHLAPVFGFVARSLELSREDACSAFVHLTVRGALSAGVRLGVVGPAEAQAMQHRLHSRMDEAVACAASLRAADVAQTTPLIEIFQATQDRLYSRLFQS